MSIELLNVSRGVNLEGLPAADVVERALELIAVRRDAARALGRAARSALEFDQAAHRLELLVPPLAFPPTPSSERDHRAGRPMAAGRHPG